MDIKIFKFPKLSMAMPADRKLLSEAKRRGFLDKKTPYNELFSNLFYNGGRLNFKKGLDPEFKEKAVPYLRTFMGSFEPKHEHKEAICALLLSELVDINPEANPDEINRKEAPME